MSDQMKIQAAVEVTTDGASGKLDALGNKAGQMAVNMAQAGEKAGKAVDQIGDMAKSSGEKFTRMESSIVASIKKATREAAQAKPVFESLGNIEFKIAEKGLDAAKFKPMLDIVRSVSTEAQATAAALNTKATPSFEKMGMSAKATAAAMRGVPAQMTDIIVSLQGGQRPMTVLLQQGGQLKDMFGGIVPAAKALGAGVMAMVNPFTLAAGAAAGLYAMYRMGAGEGEAFQKTLLMTGNAAGVTSAELQDMAARMGGIVGTQRSASAALNEFAASTKIGSGNLEAFATAALRWEEATGAAVSDTVKHFEELGKDPLKASLKLNESMGHLTASVYEQIKALTEQGRETEAAAVAQKAFADTINDRAPAIVQNIGTIERAWVSVKNAVAGAIDAFAGIGRATGLAEQLAKEEAKLLQLQDGAYQRGSARRVEQVRQQQLVIDGINAQISQETALGMIQKQIDGERTKALKAAQDLDSYLDDPSRMSRSAQMEKDVAKEKALYEARKKDAQGNSDTLKAIETAHQAAIASIKDKYKEKTGGGISTTQTELAGLHARIEAEKQRAAQLNASAGALANLNAGEKLALQYSEKIKLATKASTVAELERNKALATQAGVLERKNDEFEKEAKLQADTISKVKEQTLSLQDQIATYGLGKSAIEEVIIARLEEKKAALDGVKGNEAVIKGINDEIAARKELGSALAGKEFFDKQKKDWAAWSQDVGKIFDQVGQSLTNAIFDGGKSGKELLKDVFKSLTFRVLINPVMGSLQSSVTNSLGGLFGQKNPQQQQQGGMGGMLNNASSLNSIWGAASQAMTGASAGASTASLGYANAVGAFGGDSIGALISANGGWEGAMAGFGSAAGTAAAAGTVAGITSLGSGLGASLGATIGTKAAAITSTTFSASLGTGVAAGGGAAAGGLGAAMGAIGTAMPYIGAAVAIAAALGAFDSGPPKTRHGQRSTSELTDGTFSITQRDSRQGAGSAEAAQAMAQASVNAANDIFSKVGVNAAIESFYAVMESSVLGDRNGVASGGSLRSGDSISNFGIGKTSDMTFAGFGGWSEAEMLPRLATDIQLSILQAFQHKADELPNVMADMLSGVDIRGLGSEEVGALIARFYGVVTEVESFRTALETLPFESLKALSFDAAAGLIAAAGGLENLTTGLSSYYQNFYSQEEQLALSAKNIETALSGVSLVMPDVTQGATAAKDAFRSLFESLDPTTEAGAAAIATMLGVNESFAQLVAGMDQLNGAAAQTSAAIAQQRIGLENQLLQLQGNTVELRRRELAALDSSNHALQEQIWAIGDLTAARQRELDAIYAARSAAEQAGSDAMASLTRSVSAAKSDLQKAFDAISESLNASINTSKSAISTLESMAGRLSSTLASMRGQTDDRQSRTWAQAQISQARMAGVAPSGADFEQALQIVAQPSAGLFSTFEDYQLDFLKTANDIFALSEITGDQLTIEQRTLKTLEDQLKAEKSNFDAEMQKYDDMLTLAQSQLDVAMGINDVLLTIPEALAGIAAAIAAIKLTAPASYLSQNPDVAAAYANGSIQGKSAADAAAQHYAQFGAQEGRGSAGMELNPALSYIANNPDVAAQFASYGQSQGMDLEEYAAFHYAMHGKDEGRSFAVGTNYVPYDMKANIHEGERIIPKADNRALMAALNGGGNGNSAVVAAIDRVEKRLERLEAVGVSTAQHTNGINKKLEHAMPNGDAIQVREVVTA